MSWKSICSSWFLSLLSGITSVILHLSCFLFDKYWLFQVCCSGHGKNGTLSVLQQSIRPDLITEVHTFVPFFFCQSLSHSFGNKIMIVFSFHSLSIVATIALGVVVLNLVAFGHLMLQHQFGSLNRPSAHFFVLRNFDLMEYSIEVIFFCSTLGKWYNLIGYVNNALTLVTCKYVNNAIYLACIDNENKGPCLQNYYFFII